MRKWFILYLIVVNISLFAIIKSVAPQAEEIELVFNNVKIKSLEFIDENEFRIDAKKSTGVDITIDNNKVIFTAPEMTRVKLELPSFKKYLYRSDDGVCRFDSEHLIIEAEDGELIEFKDGNLLIIDEDKTRVEVGEKGIYVFENDETVEISSRGIIVDGEEEYKEITGFWGKLLGGVITAITRGSMHAVGKRPEKIMKYMINDQDDEENIDVWIADDEDEDEDLVREEFHKKIKPEADDRIKVINHNGAVTVEVWDEDEIDIYAELKTRKGKSELKKVELIVDEQGGLLIETRHLKKNPAVTVNYLIRIPSTTALESITSDNGRIKISGARGDVELDTSNGSIVIDNFQGNIDAGTSNGSIKVKSVKGNVILSTSNGKIDLKDIEGKADIKTSNGSIEVENVDDIESVVTSNGSIMAELQKLDDDVDFRTSNASIDLYLNPKIDAEIEAVTSNSNINLIDLEIVSQQLSNSRLVGRLGKGGSQLNLITSNGKISIINLERIKK